MTRDNHDCERYIVWWGYGSDADGCVWSKCWLVWPEAKADAEPSAVGRAYAAGSWDACVAAVRLLELELSP